MRHNRVKHLLAAEKTNSKPDPIAGLMRLLERDDRGKIWAFSHGRNSSYERTRRKDET